MDTRLEIVPSRRLDWRPASECWDFGISELLATTLPAVFATDASIAGGAALTPTLGASVLGSALPGAALGAGTSALEGKNPLIGALTGGATGGAIGGAGVLAPELGISPTLAQTVAGGATGLIGSELTGQNPLIGALGGAGSGLFSSALRSPSFSATSTAGGGAAPAAGPAVASATPTSAAPLSGDSTSFTNLLDTSPGPLGMRSFSNGGGGGGGSTGTALSSIGEPTNITGNIGATTGNATSGGGGNPGLSALERSPMSSNISAAGGTKGNWLSDALGTTGGTGVGSKIVDYLGNNPTTLLGGGLLGTTLLMNNRQIPGAAPLQQASAGLTRLGNQEVSSLTTGQVPAGAQSVLDRQRSSLDAQTRSGYAQLGLSGSTMEHQALAQNAQTVEANKWSIINDLVKQGTTTLGNASEIDYKLMLQEIAKDQATQNAIARFAAALGGGSQTSSAGKAT